MNKDLMILNLQEYKEEAQSIKRRKELANEIESSVLAEQAMYNKMENSKITKITKKQQLDEFNVKNLLGYYLFITRKRNLKVKKEKLDNADRSSLVRLILGLNVRRARSTSPDSRSKTRKKSPPPPKSTQKLKQSCKLPTMSQIDSLSFPELVNLYCDYRKSIGFPQNVKTISESWSEEMIKKALTKIACSNNIAPPPE